jgi:hypothetical protein
MRTLPPRMVVVARQASTLTLGRLLTDRSAIRAVGQSVMTEGGIAAGLDHAIKQKSSA